MTALTNGNYVVSSSYWDNGAVDRCRGSHLGQRDEPASPAPSAQPTAWWAARPRTRSANGVTALTNGNYVVLSLYWDNGAVTDAGAATWGNGTTGISGQVSAANSLVGSTADDRIGIAA